MAHILLVEDAVPQARALTRELVRAGHDVEHAADGASALRLFGRRAPDLVLLDWMLPDADGIDVLARLRRACSAPVLMLTARHAVDDRVTALRAGADDYVPKPFDVRELLARVDALLRRRRHVEAECAARGIGDTGVCDGELTLDPDGHVASAAGRALALAPKEFALLHLLLRHPGRTFSRRYLLDVIWTECEDASARSVDNVVLRVRRQLASCRDQLETVWGVGYRWRPSC